MEIKGYSIPEIVKSPKKAEKEVMVEEIPLTIGVGLENQGNKMKQTARMRFTKKGKKYICEKTGKEYSSLEEAVGMTAHYMIAELVKVK